MTERFEVNQGYNDRYIYDNLHQNILGQNRVCAIMNELDTKCSRLEKENEQLKGEVAHYKLILMSLEQEAKRISKIR